MPDFRTFLPMFAFCVLCLGLPVAAEDAARPNEAAPQNPLELTDKERAALGSPLDVLLADDDWLGDPFRHVGADMGSAADDLHAGRTKAPALMTQPRVLSRLDKLIELLEKSCNSGGGGAGGNPVRPANASTLAAGPGGEGELRAPQKSGRKWADLTQKEREKILQSQADGFPPGYEDVLADYFRRLSSSSPAAEGERRASEQ